MPPITRKIPAETDPAGVGSIAALIIFTMLLGAMTAALWLGYLS
jgi:hypothetical protein